MKKCIIIGLPSAGKSTYLGAFWAIEKDGDTGHKLVCDKYPQDSSYLDSIKADWLKQRAVSRTSQPELKEISFVLRERETNEILELSLPDFKGEKFQNILLNNVDPEIERWLNESDCILFFVKNEERDILQEEMIVNEVDSPRNVPSVMNVVNMSEWTKNTMLLKYIIETYGQKKLALCVSAWDKNESYSRSITQYISEHSPLLDNYIKEHILEYKYFGVSAQGLDYEDPNRESKETIHKKSEEYKRAYVFETEKNFDITEPLHYLLS